MNGISVIWSVTANRENHHGVGSCRVVLIDYILLEPFLEYSQSLCFAVLF